MVPANVANFVAKLCCGVLPRLHESQQLVRRKQQRIVKLKLTKSALSNFNTSPTSSHLNTKMASDHVATTPTPLLHPPEPTTIGDELHVSEERMTEILNQLLIRHIWAESKARREPSSSISSVIERPPGWILHLECKGYKSGGDLFRIGTIKSTKHLRSTIWTALKMPPKYFDLSPTTKGDIQSIEWEDVEQSLKHILSMVDKAEIGPHAFSFQPIVKDGAEPDDEVLMKTPASPSPSEPIAPKTPDQSSKSEKRKFRDPNTPLAPGDTWLNMPEVEESSPLVGPPDSQRSKLRKGLVRKMNYSADLDSPTESDEDDDDRVSSKCDDESEESPDEENDGNSSTEEYRETESDPSDDGDGGISEVSGDINIDEQGDEDQSPPRPKNISTRRKLEISYIQEFRQRLNAAVKMMNEGPEKVGIKRIKGTGRDAATTRRGEIPERPKKRRRKNKSEPKSNEKNAPIASISQALDPTQEPRSTKGAKCTSDTNSGTSTAGLAKQPFQRNDATKPESPTDQQDSTKTNKSPILTDQDMVYFSHGFKSQEILAEFKALRNLTKHNYDHYKGVEEKVAKLVEDQHAKDQKLDKLIQEVGEIRESVKEFTTVVKMLVAFCKGQEL
ncbi:hypothetical protein TWF970_006323 [Orbilia oligospora]|uniref:Uncharacterized protein n=1 Tax=Orbilia oligospora TaxID=2813651 RepID=A0A7C8V436_ORBOL|nr:hypothetical protein TWF970_006323 [Orbilia oligospora]